MIHFRLNVVRALIGYAKRLDQTLPEKTALPSFPTIAACFGTHDLRRILGHVQRGLLKAMMLERYLLARAAPLNPDAIREVLGFLLGAPRSLAPWRNPGDTLALVVVLY